MRNPLARLGVLILLLAACGSSDSLNLTFDGDSCTYEGSTEITAGSVELVFANESGAAAAVNLLELLEGRTIQDVVEYHGPEPTTAHAPWWTRSLGTWQALPAGDTQLWEGDLQPGDYYMVCARIDPPGVWLGTGLTVEG